MKTQNNTNTIEKLTIDNKTITDPKELAEALSIHFAGAGKKVAQSINTTQHAPE